MARIPDRVGPCSQDSRLPPPTGAHVLASQGTGDPADDDVGNVAQTDGARRARGPGSVPLPRLRGSCSACGIERSGLKVCAACGLAEYCGKECQLAHWREHKRACRAGAAAKAAQA
jgi:hypothetical protein